MLAASPDYVYRAFGEPAALEQGLPPDAMTGTMPRFDSREGGSYRVRLEYADGDLGRGKTSAGSDETAVRVMKLAPGRAIHHEVVFDSSSPSFSGVMRMVWTFWPHRQGSLVTVRAEDLPVGTLPDDHAQGLASSLAILARYMANAR